MASYPTSVPVFSSKADNVDDVLAAHVNALQDEVTALATGLLNGVEHHLFPEATADNRDLGKTGQKFRDLWLSGDANIGDQLAVAGAGPHIIGAASPTTDQALRIASTFSASTTGYGLVVVPTISAGAGFDAYGTYIRPTLNEAASGTHATFVGLFVDAPVIGAGAATLSNAISLYVASAPTGGTNNYALYVAGGLSSFDSGQFHGNVNFLSVGGGQELSVLEINGSKTLEWVTESSSDPTAPGANGTRLFTRDNGAGKTQLCARFNTGAVQVIATEP